MTLNLELTPHAEAWLNAEARQRGLDLGDLVLRVIEERAANVPTARQSPIIDAETDPTIALLRSWIAEDATDDPEEIRKAEEELIEFQRNMNAPRKEAGERLLFPEVE